MTNYKTCLKLMGLVWKAIIALDAIARELESKKAEITSIEINTELKDIIKKFNVYNEKMKERVNEGSHGKSI